MDRRQQLGRFGEQLVSLYMQLQGCRWRASNWRCRCGEIDRVFSRRDTLIFIEVKTRWRLGQPPGDLLGWRQQQRFERAAELFMKWYGEPLGCVRYRLNLVVVVILPVPSMRILPLGA